MRFIALLALSAVLTGCCQTRVAERCCTTQPGCKTDCPTERPCVKSQNPCGMPSRNKRCCDPPQGYACRSSLTIEWKPVKYPVLRRKKMHEVCATQKSACRTGCLNDGFVVPHSQARDVQSDRAPFGDTPVLDPPPVLNPQKPTNEATIPGVDQVPPPQNASSADASAAVFGDRHFNPQTGVPEIEDAPPVRGAVPHGYRANHDQRAAVEMWPYSPQYTGRR